MEFTLVRYCPWIFGILLALGCAASPKVVAQPPTTSPASSPGPRVVKPFKGITVRPDEHIVEIEATVCLDGGWLEQIACAPGSREHESLLVIHSKPSEIHAAMLLAGFESGRPGRWVYEKDTVRVEQPVGDEVNVFVRYSNKDGDQVEQSIRAWIRDHQGNHEFPDLPWVFGGSRFEKNPDWMEEEGEHYVADMTGSIIGLVTFGDEVLGFTEVIADKAELRPPEWEIDTEAIPPVGTKVTIILRKAKAGDDE